MLATLTWHITRASGVIAYAVLAGSTLWGLALSTRLHGKRPPRPWMLDVHRMLGGLAVLLTALHVLSIAFDNFVEYSVLDLFVPFAISWNTAGVSAGIVAMYLLAAVEVTSLLRNRQRISQSTWRRVHYLSFLLFVLSSAHFIAVGTDAASPFIVGILLAAVVSVIALTGYRIHRVVSATERTNRPTEPAPQPSPPAARPARRRAVQWSADDQHAPPPPRRTDSPHSRQVTRATV